jgi:hypothetical protein
MSGARGYAERFVREEPQFYVLRVLTTIVCWLFVVFASWSGYRAIVQVKSLELRSVDAVLHPGSTVTADAVSWARTYVSVRIELVQDAHRETIGWRQIGTHGVPSLDPRWVRATLSATLTPAMLERLHDGDARVVATALGRSQWMRVPPPTIREARVELRVSSAASTP